MARATETGPVPAGSATALATALAMALERAPGPAAGWPATSGPGAAARTPPAARAPVRRPLPPPDGPGDDEASAPRTAGRTPRSAGRCSFRAAGRPRPPGVSAAPKRPRPPRP